MSRRQVRGSSLLLVGRVTAVGVNVVTQVLLVRTLAKADFGLFAYGLAIAASCRYLLSVGQGRSLSRFLSLHQERHDYPRLFGTLAFSCATVAVTTTALFTGSVLLLDVLVPTQGGPSNSTFVFLVLLSLAPMEALDQLFVSLFAVFTRPRSIFFRKYLLTPGLRLAVVLALIATQQDVQFLVVGYVAAQVIGLVTYGVLAFRLLRNLGLLSHVRRIKVPGWEILRFSAVMLSTDLVFVSTSAGTVVLLGYYASLEEVAEYRAVFPPAHLNQLVFQSFVTLFLPMATRLYARGDDEGMRVAYWQSALMIAVLSFPVFAMTGPFAPSTTTTLFGDRYAGSSVILSVLSVGYFLNAALGFNALTMQVYGRLRFVLLRNIGAALLNVILSILLVRDYGALGVAVAACATLVAQNVVNQWGLRRTIGTAFFDRSYVRPYAMVGGAAVFLWLIEVLVSPGLAVSVVFTSVTSLSLLWLTRRALRLSETFPELSRIPGVRRVTA